MSEAPTAALSAAVAAMAAAVAEATSTVPELAEPVLASAIDPSLTEPFPQLEPDQSSLASITSEEITAATAAALSNAIVSAQLSGSSVEAMSLASPSVPLSLSSAMAGVSVQSPTTGDGGMLASLQRNTHDQVMEIMSSHHTNSHRRRSSVEAAAAASSVLASIASSTKSYMGSGDVAAALAAAAANSPSSIGSYPGHSSQHSAAAAALLAASGMHSVVMPTIPSVSTSLQGTPAPGEHMGLSAGTDDDAAAVAAIVGDVTMQGFDVAALGGLSTDMFTNAEQIATSLGSPTVDLQAALHTPGPSCPDQKVTTPTKTPGRRRKAAAGKGEQHYDSVSDGQDEVDDDEEMDGREMPLTPDASGSGRPGSLRHLTPDERRVRRLQRNRLAAKECRLKKKAYLMNLEVQICDLHEENSQLRKEVEELSAKLTLSGMRANNSALTPKLEFKPLVPPERAGEVSASRQSSPAKAPSKRLRVASRSPGSDVIRGEG
ncbi:hypothetical protein GGI20_000307 [Coemansia sp. BCRC 34301]|nr:hypothetical protein GGI20_000307 [Coemansia sp. BCRC 34301]